MSKEEMVADLVKEVADSGIYVSEALRRAWDAALESAAKHFDGMPAGSNYSADQAARCCRSLKKS